MSTQHQTDEFNQENETSLHLLAGAIELGGFSLIFARCNYAQLRDRMIQRLRELCPVDMREISLAGSEHTLYTTIKHQLEQQGDAPPAALMVYGFESVSAIERVLISSNQVREEFAKNFSFPVVLWLHDEVLKKLSNLAPDIRTWGISCEFLLETDKLVKLIEDYADGVFTQALEVGDQFISNSRLWDAGYRLEIEAVQKDLQVRGYPLESELAASLEFIWGRDAYEQNSLDTALELYQESWQFWQQGNHLERQGVLLFHIGLCYWQKENLPQEREYFQQCLNRFEEAQRQDLVAKFIGQLGKILQQLQAWNELRELANQALKLHETYATTVGATHASPLQAQDYGFLAEVALQQKKWEEANQFARQALEILDDWQASLNPSSTLPLIRGGSKISSVSPLDKGRLRGVSFEPGLYLLLLAKSQQHLKQETEAIETLKQAKNCTVPQQNPQLYIDILSELRSLYYQQRQYLEAFEIKQEQRAVEQQFGFRAFVGAGRLTSPPAPLLLGEGSKRGLGGLGFLQNQGVVGRQQDVERLIHGRITPQNQKITIIHGESGVGKSSIIDAGLVPQLKQNIGERRGLPVVLRVYTNWVEALGEALKQALKDVKNIDVPAPKSLAEILAQLQANDKEYHLLTVLIFDQFEEYFFVEQQQAKRQNFYQLLKACTNRTDVQSVRIILSLREDYLHCLLEGDRFIQLDNDDLDILSKKNRYYLGNFTAADAKGVIATLTQRSQFHLEPALIDELVRDLAGELQEVRPIELQVVGAQLETQKITTLKQYRQEGWTKTKLVEGFFEDVVRDCGVENERAARLVLYLLTDENGTRPLKTRRGCKK